MKRVFQIAVATVLLGSLTIEADPFIPWDWIPAPTYTNAQPIPSSDVQTYTLNCNTTPNEQGPPYEVEIGVVDPLAPPTTEDMAPVHGGQIGDYYCAVTQTSTAFGTTSGFSNEAVFTVTALDLGFVPNPPTNLTLQ